MPTCMRGLLIIYLSGLRQTPLSGNSQMSRAFFCAYYPTIGQWRKSKILKRVDAIYSNENYEKDYYSIISYRSRMDLQYKGIRI